MVENIRFGFVVRLVLVASITLLSTAIIIAAEPAKTSDAKSAHASILDKDLPAYKKSSDEVSGSLDSKGSDTMSNLVKYWAEAFRKNYPSVKPQINHKGSSDAPVALTKDEATFGAMSRDWKPNEIADFEKAQGVKPTNVITCIDVLAIYVHKDNPIKGLTLQQVDAIFSTDRKGGNAKDIVTWGDLGLTGNWADKKINLYGRDAASGTYQYFKEHALFKGTYKNSINAQAGSSSVIGAIAADQFGIGYSGIGYKTADVKVVPLSAETGKATVYFEANAKNAYEGTYPLARPLYLSLKKKPNTKLDPLRREFLKFVLSRDGQALAEKGEFIPITAEMAKEELEKLELNK